MAEIKDPKIGAIVTVSVGETISAQGPYAGRNSAGQHQVDTGRDLVAGTLIGSARNVLKVVAC